MIAFIPHFLEGRAFLLKKWLPFCAACLVALSGCTGGAQSTTPLPVSPSADQPSATPLSTEEIIVTPSPTPVETVPPSMPPEVSLAPEPNESEPAPVENSPPETAGWNGDPDTLTLDDFPTQLSSGADVVNAASSLPSSSAGLYLVAQLPDRDTWLYGFCGPQDAQGLILRVGAQWHAFDIPFLTPQGLLPAMAYGDYDGDLDLELAIVTHQGSGTGVNVWGLSVVDFSGGVWTALEFIPADYTAILDLSLTSIYHPEGNTVTLQAGEAVLELDLTALGYSDPGGQVEASVGGWVLFAAEDDALSGSFSIDLYAPNFPIQGLQYVATLQADVVYTGSTFGLGDFLFTLPDP